MLEVACGEHGEHGLADAVSRQESPDNTPDNTMRLHELPASADKPHEQPVNQERLQVTGEITETLPERIYVEDEEIGGKQSSLFKQFLLLYVRNLHILRRDYVS